MIHTSKLRTIRVLFAAALAMAGCSGTSGGQIPCVDDASCPNDYPVCGPAGKCIAGTSTSSKSVAVVGAEGHTAADFLSGTVRVLVTARAASGVQSVNLAVGSTNFSASATPAAPPLYAFDVDTTKLPNADASLTSTLTAGDGSSATASGTLHVDNAKPAITTFTVAGAPTTTITAGKVTAISASFTGGVSATITSSAGGSVSVGNGGSVLVTPDVATSYSLRVTSRSGVSVQSGSTGQPPDVSVSVVQPASFTGNFTVSPNVIEQGQTGTFTFTAPTLGASVTSAIVTDAAGANQGPIDSSTGKLQGVTIPTTGTGTTQLTYKLVIANGATIPDAISIPAVVTVIEPVPVITLFTFDPSGTTKTFAPGADVVFDHMYDAKGGTATVNGVPASASGSTTTIHNIRASTVYTLTVTTPLGRSITQSVTANVSAQVDAFSVGATQAASTDTAIISAGGNTKLFAAFGGSATSAAALSCAPTPACNGTLAATTISSGGNASVDFSAIPSTTGTFTYTLTVTPTTGAAATKSVTVKVVPAATTTSLVAASSTVQEGFSTTLTPTFDFGTSPVVLGTATIVADDGSTYDNPISGSATRVAPSIIDLGPTARQTTTYTLTVRNAAGVAATLRTATVTVVRGNWSALNSSTLFLRSGATITDLGNGKVLVAGGMDGTGTPVGTAELCDASGLCVHKTTMKSARAFHTAVSIGGSGPHAGSVLLAGGFDTATTVTSSAEFYDPAADTFTTTTPVTKGLVTDPRARHVAVLLNATTVLLVGGTNGTADLRNGIKYDANVEPPTTTALNPGMNRARSNFTGTLMFNGKVLVVGGRTANVAADRNAEFYDPALDTFTDTGALPSGDDKRSHTSVLITGANGNSGKVLISGGVTGSGTTVSGTQLFYTPGTGAFTTAPALGIARSNHAAIMSLNESVLICGGTSDGTSPIKSCELFDANKGWQLTAPDMLEARKDFALATITISSLTHFFAAGGTGINMTTFAEAYDAN